jgi:hypothetical protein
MATKKRQTTWPGKGIPHQQYRSRIPEPAQSWLEKYGNPERLAELQSMKRGKR